MKKSLGIFIIAAVGWLTLPTALPLAADTANSFELTILHTNDTHAALGGSTPEGLPCYAAQCPGGSGGAVRLKQAIDDQRETKTHVLLLDAGDQAQGTLFYHQHKSLPSAHVMNILGYDAAVPGNHEYDDGCPNFAAYEQALKAPIVAANLQYTPGEARPEFAPWIIVQRGARQIGIVGLMTPETLTSSRPCAAVSVGDPAAALRRAVQELRAQQVNIIIAVTHLGIAEDRALAKQIGGVDVIVGGHTHTYLSNISPKAEGAYPIVETSPEQEPVLIVTARNGGRLLGALDVSFDAKGKATRWSGEPISLNGKTKANPDANLVSLLTTYAEPLQKLLQEQTGVLQATLPQGQTLLDPDVRQCRVRQCSTGDILADALLWAGKEDGAQAAISGGGSVRASLHVGMISVGDVLGVMPFENLLMTGTVDGSLLLRILEYSLSGIENGEGRFPQTAGLHILGDPHKPVGQRLVRAEIADGKGGYSLVRPEGRYRIAVTDYMVDGGDGYSMLQETEWKNSGKGFSQILVDYLRTHSPLILPQETRTTLSQAAR